MTSARTSTVPGRTAAPGPMPLAAVRAGWATGCLLAPRAVVARLLDLAPDDRWALTAVRLLGARDLAQTALTAAVPAPAVRTAGVWIDSLHAASMLGLAAAGTRYRRAALINFAVAVGWVALGRRRSGPPAGPAG
jgi:hypothetical protein